MTDKKLIDVIAMAAQIGLQAAAGVPAAKEAYLLITTMKAEGRDPTPEEFARLASVTKDLHDRIQGA